jgi:hypothetical protein
MVEPAEEIPFVEDVKVAGLLVVPEATTKPLLLHSAVLDAITKTLPTGPGQRYNLIFKFARRLKAIAGLDTSPAALLTYIKEWHRQALPNIRTKQFQTTEIDFYDSWENSKVPLSDEHLWNLVHEKLKQPDPAWFRDWFFPQSGKRLLRVCIALQEYAGDKHFFLSARRAGDAIGMAPKDANALLRRLVKRGILEVVEKGTYQSGQATTFRYIGPPSLSLAS